MVTNDIVIAGGGLAGAVAAITAAASSSERPVTWLVGEDAPLGEFRRHGSDGYLVTRPCDDPAELLPLFPRGGHDALPELYDFGPAEVIAWCDHRGLSIINDNAGVVRLSDDSPGLAVELTRLAEQGGVDIRTGETLLAVDAKPQGGFWVTVNGERTVICNQLILAGDPLNIGAAARMAESLGHQVELPVPSLFNFVINHPLLKHIQHEGLADIRLELPDLGVHANGPAELHPWGISGPAVLELSCRVARELVQAKGKALRIKWLGEQKVARLIDERVRLFGRQRLITDPLGELPHRLWENLLLEAGCTPDQAWHELNKTSLRRIKEVLELTELPVSRKKLYLAERAICGGVARDEIDFTRMASQRVPGLFFAGDIIDVDGFAGGAHRQWHWTSGHSAGRAAAKL